MPVFLYNVLSSGLFPVFMAGIDNQKAFLRQRVTGIDLRKIKLLNTLTHGVNRVVSSVRPFSDEVNEWTTRRVVA